MLEPLSGYLAQAVELSQNQGLHGEPYNFGPTSSQDNSVSELINAMGKYWENVRWNDISSDREHLQEASLLKLNCDKALFDLNWLPTLRFDETVRFTVEWYKTYHQGDNPLMQEHTVAQIDEYMKLAVERGIAWAQP